MANTIQIKHGSGAPSSSALASNELGFDTTNNALYIGKGSSVLRLAPFNGSTGGTLATGGYIAGPGVSSSWVKGRVNALIRQTTINGYSPIWSIKTTNGSWDVGAYDNSGSYDSLLFNYITDTDYNNSNNQRTAYITFTYGGRIGAYALNLASTTDASGTVYNAPALVIGGANEQHIEIDGNEILSKTNGTTPGTLYLQDSTGSVSVDGTGGLYVRNGGIGKPTTSANNVTYNWISAGGGYGTGSGKSGLKLICCEQSDGTSGIGQDLTGLTYELCIAASESTSNVAYITFAKHKLASPTSYTRLGYFDSSGNFSVIGAITAPSGNIWAGTAGNTASERQVGVASGAGSMYMWSHASTSGSRGIWLPAHGSGSSKYVFSVDTNNNVTFQGTLSGNASSASTANSAGRLFSLSDIGSSSTTHATALQNYFNSNKSTVARNALINFYDASSGNGSMTFGYFLNGYDSTPYGGFFVAHYNNAYYVGINNGSYSQQRILTSTNYTSYFVYSSSAPSSPFTGMIWLKPI